MPKHSRGPWAYDGRQWIRDANGLGLFNVSQGMSTPADRTMAAAAPVMLDTLREALFVLQSVAAINPDWHAAAMARDSVSAAIASAEG